MLSGAEALTWVAQFQRQGFRGCGRSSAETDADVGTEIRNRETYAPGVRIFATCCLRGYIRGLTAAGKDGGLGTVTAAELGQDVTHMGVDGALGDEEPLGDLLVRQAPGDQLSDLVFALSEREFLLRT